MIIAIILSFEPSIDIYPHENFPDEYQVISLSFVSDVELLSFAKIYLSVT